MHYLDNLTAGPAQIGGLTHPFGDWNYMVRDVPLSGGKRLKCRGVVPEGKTVAPPIVVLAPVVRLQPQGGGGFIFKKRTASQCHYNGCFFPALQ